LYHVSEVDACVCSSKVAPEPRHNGKMASLSLLRNLLRIARSSLW